MPHSHLERNPRDLIGVIMSLWSLIAGLCCVLAGFLWYRGHTDGAFVVATLGLTAWFLNVRNQLRTQSIENEPPARSSQR